jgi:hypothetical protein
MTDHATTLIEARPDGRAVLYRAHCLGALVQRWEFEQTIQGFDEMSIVEIHRGLSADLGKWIDAEGLATHFAESERPLLAEPLGRWSRDAADAVSWRIESLGIFVWALGLIKSLLPYDRRFSHDDLLLRLRIGKPLQPLLAKTQLRPIAELQLAQEAARLWQWRAQAHLPGTTGQMPAHLNLPDVIAATARTARQQGLIPEPIGGDFPAFDHPYRELSPDQTALVVAIARERAAAFLWLCGPPRQARQDPASPR